MKLHKIKTRASIFWHWKNGLTWKLPLRNRSSPSKWLRLHFPISSAGSLLNYISSTTMYRTKRCLFSSMEQSNTPCTDGALRNFATSEAANKPSQNIANGCFSVTQALCTQREARQFHHEMFLLKDPNCVSQTLSKHLKTANTVWTCTLLLISYSPSVRTSSLTFASKCINKAGCCVLNQQVLRFRGKCKGSCLNDIKNWIFPFCSSQKNFP